MGECGEGERIKKEGKRRIERRGRKEGDDNNDNEGTSLVVQWLGLYTPNERAHVQTLGRELRLHKPQLSLAQPNK